jgi:hypothetical protein
VSRAHWLCEESVPFGPFRLWKRELYKQAKDEKELDTQYIQACRHINIAKERKNCVYAFEKKRNKRWRRFVWFVESLLKTHFLG